MLPTHWLTWINVSFAHNVSRFLVVLLLHRALRSIAAKLLPFKRGQHRRQSQIQSFLGLAGFCCRFVHDFSSIAVPLHELTKKDVPFAWSDSQEVAFRTLKDNLTHAPHLQFPGF
jgi:hypothetical protein